MPARRTAVAAAAIILAAMQIAAPALSAPNVVATVAPIHSLAARVMAGVATPQLLLPVGASPHAYALRPSDSRKLAGADLVIWVGGNLESFLERPLRSLGAKARVLRLESVATIAWLANREAGAWESEAHRDHEHAHGAKHDPRYGHGDAGHRDRPEGSRAAGSGPLGSGPDGSRNRDPHIWLDTGNAAAIAQAVADALAEIDPPNAARYRENARQAAADLARLKADLARILEPVARTPFVVFHDAYQYFEREFGLAAVGSITLSPERKPGARRLLELQRKIAQSAARCVFAEPQFSPAIVSTVLRGTSARSGVLDPQGTGLAPGPAFYDTLMRNMAADLAGCLGTGS